MNEDICWTAAFLYSFRRENSRGRQPICKVAGGERVKKPVLLKISIIFPIVLES